MLVGHATRNSVFDRVRRLFGGMPAHVQAAALPWRGGEDGPQVLLITSRGTGRWVIPKGWPEGREPLSMAAEREALEEAGVRGTISPVSIGRFFYGKKLSSGFSRHCEVHVFPLAVTALDDEWPEQGQRERRWVPVVEAAGMVEEPDLGEIIAEIGRQRRT